MNQQESLTKIKIKFTPQQIQKLNSIPIIEQAPEIQNDVTKVEQKTKIPQETLYKYAQQAALRTNARMNKAKQDLEIAMKTLQKNRQGAQPYLNNSIHFQSDNYPVIITDSSGKSLYNNNNSNLGITQSNLDMFIKRNLNEEPNNYLSEVAGYNNFAIQNRRRRKHHFE